ncbi:MAG: hypothetical protein LBJ23_00355 [Tannerella sp.]|jgi:hypothetical protein|nr:hypothetical protein [Tannerella sp.]
MKQTFEKQGETPFGAAIEKMKVLDRKQMEHLVGGEWVWRYIDGEWVWVYDDTGAS